jgi:carboxypeptidase family protein
VKQLSPHFWEFVLKRFVLAVLSFCATAGSLAAQRSLIYGTISGRVIDATGAAVSGATITVLESETLTSQSVTSDRNGGFRFVSLAEGQYEVTVHQANYTNVTRTVVVHAGSDADLSLSMTAADWPPATPRGQLILESPRKLPERDSLLLPDAPVGSFRDEDTIDEFRMSARANLPAAALLTSEFSLLHGEVYGLSGSSLTSWDALQAPVNGTFTGYGAALGGRANHNRNAYFLGIDRERLGLTADSSPLKELGGSIVASGPPDATQSLRNPVTASQFLARLDHEFNERDSANMRYTRSSVAGEELKADPRGLKATQQSGAFDNSVAISPSTVNETNAQFIKVSAQIPGGEPAWGIASGLPTARRFKVYEAADNVYHQAGRQGLRAGGDFLFDQMRVSFLDGSVGGASFGQSSRSAGFYAQNQWKMSEGLVFTAGIRYDLEFLRNVRTDTNNLGPQIGFAWSPGGSRSTVIRGGYGVMYEQVPLPAIAGLPEGSSDAVNLLHAGTLSVGRNSLPVDSLGSFTTVNPSIQNGYAEVANLEFEQQIGTRSVLSASYQYVRGVELTAPGSNNVALCAAAAGCAPGNEFFAWGQYDSGSSSSYDGLTVALVEHPAQWGDYKVAYTYADGQGSMYNTIVGDQMRRVAFTSTLHTPFTAGSGLWQHFTHGVALSGYGDLTRHNELPDLDFIHLNAQLTKSFQLGSRTRLEFIAQTSDMREHRNYSTSRAISELGEYGGDLLSFYARFAAIGTPNGTQAGLRLKF